MVSLYTYILKVNSLQNYIYPTYTTLTIGSIYNIVEENEMDYYKRSQYTTT